MQAKLFEPVAGSVNSKREICRLTSWLFLFLLILPHFSFRFGTQKEKILPHPYWVEVQNRDALETWETASRKNSTRNLLLAPLQDSRRRALEEASMVLKAPALLKAEEVVALNALKISMLENRGHQVDIKYEEVLLGNSLRQSFVDVRARANQYQVKLKKERFNNPRKISKLRKNLLKKFHAQEESSVPRQAFDADAEAASLSGFSFKGAWRDAFDVLNTRAGEFDSGETRASIPMMMKAGYHGYFEDENFQALDLRYGDGKVSFFIFLPRSGMSLDTFYADLNFKNWSRWMAGFIERQGTVQIPRFKIKTLSDSLCQLTLFEIAEKGGKDSFRYDMTEVLGSEERFDFKVNHSFFFAVRDNETDLIILMGQFIAP